jgi:hypothetical protein
MRVAYSGLTVPLVRRSRMRTNDRYPPYSVWSCSPSPGDRQFVEICLIWLLFTSCETLAPTRLGTFAVAYYQGSSNPTRYRMSPVIGSCVMTIVATCGRFSDLASAPYGTLTVPSGDSAVYGAETFLFQQDVMRSTNIPPWEAQKTQGRCNR